MTSASLDSESRWAILWQPDGRQMSLRVSVESDRVRGLTGREARRVLGSTLRLGLDYSVTVSAEVYAASRENMDSSLGERPIQVPLWPGEFYPAESLTLSTRWFALGTPSDTGALPSVTWSTTTPAPSGVQVAIPTMRGYLTQPPEWELIDPRWVQASIRFDEAGPATEALTLASASWGTGPTVAGVTTYVFPKAWLDFTSDWSPGPAGVVVEYNQRLGLGRDRSRAVYPQLAARAPEHSLTFDRIAELGRFLRWIQDHGGSVKPFWLPVWSEELHLAADTSSGSANITVTNAALLGSHRRIVLVAPDGTWVPRSVSSIAGNVLTLDSTPGTLTAAGTMILTLALVRFASDQFTIDCTRMPRWARTTVKFEEVREEVTTPAGETAGTTIGQQTALAYLYEFTAGAESWSYTSRDADVSTYTAAQIEHGEIADSGLWDASKVSIRTGIWATNPLVRVIAGTLWERLECVIKEADPTNVPGARVIFRGFVRAVQRRSGSIQADVDSLSALFSRKVPRTLMQNRDNFALGEIGNDLSLAAWTFTASATAQTAEVVTLNSFTWPGGALPTMAAEYFALGYAVRPAPNYARIPILSSTARTAGALQITLAYAPSPAVTTTETEWKLVPGYDGTFTTSEAKFANGDHFGGFPFIPAAAPNLIAIKRNTGNSGKK